ncbi:MAG: hypothetical protein ACYSUI_08045 [Planctomycetota bacterium]
MKDRAAEHKPGVDTGHSAGTPGYINESPEALRTYLESRGVQIATVKPGTNGATTFLLKVCPMVPDHGGDSGTAVLLAGNGAIAFRCHHNRCARFKWADVREQIDPGYRHRGNGTTQDDAPRKSQATMLVELGANAELFHAPGDDGDAYATIQVGHHRETYAVNRRGFRRWLVGQFYRRFKRAPGSQALQDALAVLAAKATYEGPELPAAVRLAEHGGAFWLDLADADWRAVRIGPDGWQVVSDPPVKFIRPRGMLSLPVPVGGGSIAELRRFVNIADDGEWALLLAWLVAALCPSGPYAVLTLHGEQGSAKSTACKVLRALVDPNAAPLRSEPREVRDLAIAASNAWLLAFDNLSHLQPWLSDGLCRLATGGGFATRELYSDSDEKLFDSMRPVLLNGIEELATRGDLLDRAIILTLPQILDTKRRPEAELWRDLDSARPRILGALLDAVSVAIRRLPTVQLSTLPRMADFARWAVAAEPALDLKPGTFLAAYADARAVANESAIEASAIGAAVLGLMASHDAWQGTAAELLVEIESDRHSDEKTRKRRGWPKKPHVLGGMLRRIGPNLRAAGVKVTFDRESGKRRRRIIRLERVRAQASEASEASDNPIGATENAESRRTLGQPASVRQRLQASDANRNSEPEKPVSDSADASDGEIPTDSDEVVEWVA